MGPRAGLEGCGKSRPHRDSILGPSSRYPGPHCHERTGVSVGGVLVLTREGLISRAERSRQVNVCNIACVLLKSEIRVYLCRSSGMLRCVGT